ncbi:MAG TPA: hypothetical protein VMX75_07210 [Spirochaetia bacterium]|nr:hypothetical protein [Spirochaetia bacterium]
MRIKTGKSVFAVASFVAGFVLFLRFPDLDIRLLGIGYHRYFLFHSAIIPVLGLVLLRKHDIKNHVVFLFYGFLCGLSLSIGFHLLLDVFQPAAVKFPFVGSLIDGTSIDDRVWEGINSLVCMGIGLHSSKALLKGLAVK